MPTLYWEFYDRWIAPAVVAALEVDLHHGVIARVAERGYVLDVGSGGGQHAVRIAADRPDLRIAGLDNAPAMVRRAGRLARRHGLAGRVTFQLGDALGIPFPDGTFDVVYCAGPLKQVQDKARVLRECYRVLRAGGELLVMDVQRGCTHQDVVAFCDRSGLPAPLKPLLKAYFLNYVAAQSLDLDEARALWSQLEWDTCDGPRPIPGHPAFVMRGRKPHP